MLENKVIILGGDGLIGYPLSLRLSNLNYEVLIIDNLSRRNIDIELESFSLNNIKTIEERLSTWNSLTNKEIKFENINIATEFDLLCSAIEKFKPTTIIHLAEQRSAPYSMKNNKTRRYTVNNNLNGTNNVLCAIITVDPNIHLIHLGTMGVYGYGSVPDTVIPEGYISVDMQNSKGEKLPVEILHPMYPGSIYHMTKCQDQLLFQFYANNYKLKITDLHQGIVWGFETKETKLHNDLCNRFDFDSDYGTVLNRFIIQVLLDIPLTVYGTGEQTRAFIHIENSMDCIQLAIENPPKSGDKVKIFNQMTETFELNKLAELIRKTFYDVRIGHINNPRNEKVSNSLSVSNKSFLDLGLNVIKINSTEIIKIYNYIQNCVNLNPDRDQIKKLVYPSSFWSIVTP